jgi:diphosphomevalonate decarboxylase
MTDDRTACAVAHPNIALAKYWGKRPRAGNVPATPSVSLTLSAPLLTQTRVQFDPALRADTVEINGQTATSGDRTMARVVRVLDEVRVLAATTDHARVSTKNSFPTSSGLASSASGFAALVVAASEAAGLSLTPAQLSQMARRASASAARSIFAGWVRLGTQDDAAAEPIAPPDHMPIVMLVCAVTDAPKSIGSTEAMELTRLTSPYYSRWLEDALSLEKVLVEALARRDLEAIGTLAEASALRMHSCMLASSPPILYFQPATIALIEKIRQLRKHGLGAWFTIDAGPHVKVICSPNEAPNVFKQLQPLCGSIMQCAPGDGARLEPACAF